MALNTLQKLKNKVTRGAGADSPPDATKSEVTIGGFFTRPAGADGEIWALGVNAANAKTWRRIYPAAATVSGANTVQLVNNTETETTLPATSAYSDGAEISYNVLIATPGLPSLGTAAFVLLADAADTIVGFGDGLRVWEGGRVVLRCDRANTRWLVVDYDPGMAEDARTYASNAGDDAAPGSSAHPVRTIRRAWDLAGSVPWRTTGDCVLGAAYTDDPMGGSDYSALAVPGPRTQSGAPFRVVGGWRDVAAFGTTTLTGSSAYAAGPPVAWATATYGAKAAFANDAARGLFALFSGGNYNGVRVTIARSTNVATQLSSTQFSTLAPTNGSTFVVQEPDAEIQATDELVIAAGTGNAIRFEGVTLQGDGFFALLFRGVAVEFVGSRVPALYLSTDSPLAIAPGTVNTGTALDEPAVKQWLFTDPFFARTSAYVKNLRVAAQGCADVVGGVIESVIVYPQGAAQLRRCDFGRAASDVSAAAVSVYGSGEIYDSRSTCLVDAGGNTSSGEVAASNVTFNGASYGFYVSANGRAWVSQIQGTATGIGLVAEQGGRIRVADPNTTTTITGGTAAVQVGILGNKTLAQINAGAVADCLEIAGAFAAGSYVGK